VDHGGLVVVSTQPSLADAELLVGLLRSGGIVAVVRSMQDAAYPTTVAGGHAVCVRAEDAEQAAQLMAQAEHVDPADPASSLDVGLPVDDDVRDYLRWKGGADDDPSAGPPAPTAPDLELSVPQAGRLPVLPLLLVAGLVVAVVLLLR
jgi:hypothetical protein